MRLTDAVRVGLFVAVALMPWQLTAEEALDEGLRYVPLDPTFVANYGYSENGHLAYVRTDVSLQVNSQAAENAVIYHTPALRSVLVMALSRQQEDGVATTAGRDQVRAEVLEEIRAFLKEEEGEPFIEDLLFTNFIVQR
jgi:flagellar FliL protein